MLKRTFSTAQPPRPNFIVSGNIRKKFKIIPQSFFVEITDMIKENDSESGKQKVIKYLMPHIRKEIHLISERQTYKMLWPLA